MEVSSGEYDVDLVKAANTMMRFKPEPAANGSYEDNVPTIPALPSPMGKYIVTHNFFIYIYYNILLCFVVNFLVQYLY